MRTLMSEELVTDPRDTVGLGLAYLLLLHFLQIPMAFVTHGLSLPLFGVSQCFYVIPVAIVFLRKRNKEVFTGLMIGAALTIIFNAACAVIFYICFGSF